jgi:hypothetical protein
LKAKPAIKGSNFSTPMKFPTQIPKGSQESDYILVGGFNPSEKY